MRDELAARWRLHFAGIIRQAVDALRRAEDGLDHIFADPPDGRYVIEQVWRAGQCIAEAAGVVGDLCRDRTATVGG